MTQARSQVINLDWTPYYHCIGRCVRRAFLCGEDRYSGQSFEHRRRWIVDLVAHLERYFCIDVAAFALMSNHYHLVLHVDREAALQLSDREVALRWLNIEKGCALMHRYANRGPVADHDMEEVKRLIAIWRDRLFSISWFMKKLNETISKKANAEDKCTGKFWESRFKCQALLDEAALLTCMAYVDLNPIRAGLSKTPEQSDYTSIQQRIQPYRKERKDRICSTKNRNVYSKDDGGVTKTHKIDFKNNAMNTIRLMSFEIRGGSISLIEKDARKNLPFLESDYIQWVEYLGRICSKGKRGAIPGHIKPIFERLDMEVDIFMKTLGQLEILYPARMGQYATLVNYANRNGLKWCHGFSHGKLISIS